MDCDICGKETENLFNANIEGALSQVCNGCSSLGKIIPSSKNKTAVCNRYKREIKELEEPEEILSERYDMLIKRSREKMGLTQKEFAKKISEKESIVHKLETKSIRPSRDLAFKIERYLGIKILNKAKDADISPSRKNTAMTIGDIIKRKER